MIRSLFRNPTEDEIKTYSPELLSIYSRRTVGLNSSVAEWVKNSSKSELFKGLPIFRRIEIIVKNNTKFVRFFVNPDLKEWLAKLESEIAAALNVPGVQLRYGETPVSELRYPSPLMVLRLDPRGQITAKILQGVVQSPEILAMKNYIGASDRFDRFWFDYPKREDIKKLEKTRTLAIETSLQQHIEHINVVERNFVKSLSQRIVDTGSKFSDRKKIELLRNSAAMTQLVGEALSDPKTYNSLEHTARNHFMTMFQLNPTSFVGSIVQKISECMCKKNLQKKRGRPNATTRSPIGSLFTVHNLHKELIGLELFESPKQRQKIAHASLHGNIKMPRIGCDYKPEHKDHYDREIFGKGGSMVYYQNASMAPNRIAYPHYGSDSDEKELGDYYSSDEEPSKYGQNYVSEDVSESETNSEENLGENEEVIPYYPTQNPTMDSANTKFSDTIPPQPEPYNRPMMGTGMMDSESSEEQPMDDGETETDGMYETANVPMKQPPKAMSFPSFSAISEIMEPNTRANPPFPVPIGDEYDIPPTPTPVLISQKDFQSFGNIWGNDDKTPLAIPSHIANQFADDSSIDYSTDGEVPPTPIALPYSSFKNFSIRTSLGDPTPTPIPLNQIGRRMSNDDDDDTHTDDHDDDDDNDDDDGQDDETSSNLSKTREDMSDMSYVSDSETTDPDMPEALPLTPNIDAGIFERTGKRADKFTTEAAKKAGKLTTEASNKVALAKKKVTDAKKSVSKTVGKKTSEIDKTIRKKGTQLKKNAVEATEAIKDTGVGAKSLVKNARLEGSRVRQENKAKKVAEKSSTDDTSTEDEGPDGDDEMFEPPTKLRPPMNSDKMLPKSSSVRHSMNVDDSEESSDASDETATDISSSMDRNDSDNEDDDDSDDSDDGPPQGVPIRELKKTPQKMTERQQLEKKLDQLGESATLGYPTEVDRLTQLKHVQGIFGLGKHKQTNKLKPAKPQKNNAETSPNPVASEFVQKPIASDLISTLSDGNALKQIIQEGSNFMEFYNQPQSLNRGYDSGTQYVVFVPSNKAFTQSHARNVKNPSAFVDNYIASSIEPNMSTLGSSAYVTKGSYAFHVNPASRTIIGANGTKFNILATAIHPSHQNITLVLHNGLHNKMQPVKMNQ